MDRLNNKLIRILYILLDDNAWRVSDAHIGSSRLIVIFEMRQRRRTVCPKCAAAACHRRIGTRIHKALHHLLLLNLVRLEVRVKQPLIHCRSCHQKSVCYPRWLKKGKYHTEPFRQQVCHLTQSMSFRAVSRLLGISALRVRKMKKEVLTEGMPPIATSKIQ